MHEILCRRPAMATLFEIVLVGEDEEHLCAVGEAALDEITRLECILSCHDASAELARINREATIAAVPISSDLFEALRLCRELHEQTDGWFDPCAGRGGHFRDAIELYPSLRVRIHSPDARIDLGGFGKGHALDQAAAILNEFGISNFLMHGGTSSARAKGTRADGSPWRIALRSPHDKGEPVATIDLQDASLSCSAVDVVNPVTREVVRLRAGTVAIAASGSVAEAWSTAALAMGRERAAVCRKSAGLRLGWIDDTGTLAWL